MRRGRVAWSDEKERKGKEKERSRVMRRGRVA
jgi:hypothetical protein